MNFDRAHRAVRNFRLNRAEMRNTSRPRCGVANGTAIGNAMYTQASTIALLAGSHGHCKDIMRSRSDDE